MVCSDWLELTSSLCVVISTEMSKDDLIGLIDKSHLVLPQKRPLWHKAITEYYNGQ